MILPNLDEVQPWLKADADARIAPDAFAPYPLKSKETSWFFVTGGEVTAKALARWLRALKGGEGSGFHGHAGRPGKRGGSAPHGATAAGFSTAKETEEIAALKRAAPAAKPVTLRLSDAQVKQYKEQYRFWKEQASTDWDRVKRLEEADLFAPVLVNGTPDHWWPVDGSHRLAILANREQAELVAYFADPENPYNQQPTTAGTKRIDTKVWNGEPEAATSTLSKLQTGAIGEKLVIDLLTEAVGVPFGTVNLGVNNAPFDVAGNGFAVEVKTGMATNGKSAMHWRATIGQPGKAEQELLKQMGAEEKRAHNQWKEQEILKRKHALLDRMTEEAGKEIKPLTIGVILSADGKRADVYRFEGFHLRLPWNRYATDEYYMGSYETGA